MFSPQSEAVRVSVHVVAIVIVCCKLGYAVLV